MNQRTPGPHPRAASARKLAVVSSQPPKRRSTRMVLTTVISMSGKDRQGEFTTSVRATNLNRYGAAIQSNRELPISSVITLRNRGAELSARIVTRTDVGDGLLFYGIEFLEHDERSRDFWGIVFPGG